MCAAKLADTTVVPKSNANGHEITGQGKSMQDAPVSAKQTRTDTPLTQEAGPLNMPLVHKMLNTKNLLLKKSLWPRGNQVPANNITLI